MSFYPFVPHEISVLIELILGHLRYLLTDVPPQPNSPPDYVLDLLVDKAEVENLARGPTRSGGDHADNPAEGGIPRAYSSWLQKEAPPLEPAAPT